MLILFDIDATLITTARAGIRAMGEAGRALFGPSFDESRAEYAGRLDPLIMHDLLAAHGQPADAAAIARFRAAYKRHLEALLENGGRARPCPGVIELLERLAHESSAALGLLTGNFPETGALKLTAGGVDPSRFEIRVWGEDSPHDPPAREHLPPVAMARYRARFGRAIDAARVTIVGDTPHDVSCGKAHGCRVLAVATGHFTSEELSRAGADLAVRDLSDTETIARWLLTP